MYKWWWNDSRANHTSNSMKYRPIIRCLLNHQILKVWWKVHSNVFLKEKKHGNLIFIPLLQLSIFGLHEHLILLLMDHFTQLSPILISNLWLYLSRYYYSTVHLLGWPVHDKIWLSHIHLRYKCAHSAKSDKKRSRKRQELYQYSDYFQYSNTTITITQDTTIWTEVSCTHTGIYTVFFT